LLRCRLKNQSNVAVACAPRNVCCWWARLVDCLKSEAVDSEDANCFASPQALISNVIVIKDETADGRRPPW
jgi:hypothetical protein